MITMQQLELLDGQATDDRSPQDQWRVRVSPRARNMTINVIPHKGIEVVVPRRTSSRAVERFVNQHKQWIEETQKELNQSVEAPLLVLPESIHLKSIEKVVAISYQCTVGTRGWRYLGKNAIGIGCRRSEFSKGRGILKKWLQHEGKRWLVPWLRDVSDELALTFKRVQVRGQKTRWGSYSSTGTLSVNYYLMLLEPELVRYLFVHELCHTQHMNHSKKFWTLVKTFDRHYRKKEARLNQTRELIPAWLLEH